MTKLKARLKKVRDEMADRHFHSLDPLDQKNDHDGVMYIEKRFGSFCYGFDACLELLLPVVEALQDVLDQGNEAVVGHWDATDQMKLRAYAELSALHKRLDERGGG